MYIQLDLSLFSFTMLSYPIRLLLPWPRWNLLHPVPLSHGPLLSPGNHSQHPVPLRRWILQSGAELHQWHCLSPMSICQVLPQGDLRHRHRLSQRILLHRGTVLRVSTSLPCWNLRTRPWIWQYVILIKNLFSLFYCHIFPVEKFDLWNIFYFLFSWYIVFNNNNFMQSVDRDLICTLAD